MLYLHQEISDDRRERILNPHSALDNNDGLNNCCRSRQLLVRDYQDTVLAFQESSALVFVYWRPWV